MKNTLVPPTGFSNFLPFFGGLTGAQRAQLASRCSLGSITRNALIFIEGDEAVGFYWVLSGKIKIFRMSPDGREAVLNVFGPGEPFGEVAVFQGGNFPASAQCVEAGDVLFCPRSALLEAIKADPDVAMNMLAELSRRLRGFVSKIELLTLMETPQRLASYLLLSISEQNGNPVVTLDVSKALLAGMLGTARETLSRCLGRFVEEGVLKVEGRTVHVLDIELLKRLAEGANDL